MCYIAGMVSKTGKSLDKNRLESFLNCLGEKLPLRGRDAIGTVLLTEPGVLEFREVLDNKDPRKTCRESLRAVLKVIVDRPIKGIFIQTRAIPEPEFLTGAGNTIKNIQPFYIGSWITSHSGTFSNFEELWSKVPERYKDEAMPNVDSVILPVLLVEKDEEKVLSEIKGSFAIAAYNVSTNCFFLAKNFQPLYYDENFTEIFYASLPTEYTTKEFPAYSVRCFHFSDYGSTYTQGSYSLYPETENKSVLVCLSSGLDSTVTLRLYQALGYKVSALFFDYGQYAKKVERHCSRKICRELGITRYTQKLPMDDFSSPLLSDKKQELRSLEDAETTFSYVPQRNLIMASYALGYAEQLGLGGIAIGMNLSDAGAYPDNGVPFLYKLNEITPYSSNWGVKLKVSAPLVNLMKSEIIEVGLKIGVPFTYVCSCYYPELDGEYPRYCGKCGSDVHYENAWHKLGYEPPNFGFTQRYKTPEGGDSKLKYELDNIPYGWVIGKNL